MLASKLERLEEGKGGHVLERNGFRSFDFTVGGSHSKVVQDSSGSDVQRQGKESEARQCEHARWPRFTFNIPFQLRVRWVVALALSKPGP